MKLFVTGGTGFIGSHLVALAAREGHHVSALRRAASATGASAPGVEWHTSTLREPPLAALAECDVLVHLAAVGVSPQRASWDELFTVNVADSLRLWQAAAAQGVRRFIICGSCFEYGRSAERYDAIPVDAPLEPVNGYGASKAAATLAAQAFARAAGLSLTVLRPFHVFGEGQHPANFWPSLRAAALSGQDFPMTAGEQVRDFTPVEAVARAFLDAATADHPPGKVRVANLGTGQPESLRAFATQWWQYWGATGELKIGALPTRAHEVMRYVPQLA